MTKAATGFIEFEGDYSQIDRGARGQASKLEGTFGSTFKRIAAAASAALAAVGIGRFLKSAFSEAEESQKVARQTAAVIKSTGGAAHVTAKNVDELSNSLSAKAGVDDELIASGEDVLLTFTNIRNEVGKGNDVFDQATGLALDMSRALGTDLQSSVIQVGKALNDPIKGVTALQRVGVSFTQQQKDQIKTLVESGRSLDAQKLVLGELRREFGGTAAAVASPTEKLGVAFKNIEESLGLVFLPLLNKVSTFLTNTVSPAIQRFIPFVTQVGQAVLIAVRVGFGGGSIKGITGWLRIFALVGVALRGLLDFVRGDVASAGVQIGKLFGLQEDDPRVTSIINALTTIRGAISSVVEFIRAHWKPVLAVAVAALALFFAPITTTIAALVALYVRFQLVRDIVADVVVAVQTATRFLTGLPWGAIFQSVAGAISTAVATIRAVVGGIVGFFQSHAKDFAAIGKQLVAVWQQLVPTLKATFAALVAVVRIPLGLIVGIVVVAVRFLQGLWDRFGGQLLDHLRIAFNAVVLVVRGALQIIQGILEVFTGILTGHWSKAWDGLKDIVGGVGKVLLGAVKALVNGISTEIGLGMALISEIWSAAWGRVRGFVVGVFNAVLGFVKRWWPLLLAPMTGGLSLVVGLFISHFDQIRSLVSGVISDVVGFFKALPGRIIGTIGRIASAALAVGKAIIASIVSGVTGAVGKVGDIGKSIANAAIHFLNDKVLSSIRSGIHTLANALADVNIPGVGRAFDAASSLLNAAANHIPNIPTLDTGAVITDPTLAVLALRRRAQPEIVTPEGLMRQVFSDVLADSSKQHGPIDASINIAGDVFGVDDLDRWADERDRKLGHALAAGAAG